MIIDPARQECIDTGQSPFEAVDAAVPPVGVEPTLGPF